MHVTWLSKRRMQGCWDHIVFRSITSVMKSGLGKQLGFEDLLLLPTDMDPSTCHEKLLSSWQHQQNNSFSNASLFRAIFSAYGWPYLRLGLLKVFLLYAVLESTSWSSLCFNKRMKIEACMLIKLYSIMQDKTFLEIEVYSLMRNSGVQLVEK